MMVWDWLALGDAFTSLGFMGVSGFLLWERHMGSKGKESLDRELAKSIQNQAMSVLDLSQALRELSKSQDQLREEVHLIIVSRRNDA